MQGLTTAVGDVSNILSTPIHINGIDNTLGPPVKLTQYWVTSTAGLHINLLI